MLDPIVVWLFTLLAIGTFLYVAEVFIPSHGVLSVLATGCIAAVVVLCFALSRWLGAGVLLALAILGPFGVSIGVSVWQRTPVGKRMVLTATTGQPVRPLVLIGSTGRTMTELRPMGECEFGETRIQARSELSQLVAAGKTVRIIALNDGVATVRPLDADAQQTGI